MLGGRNPADNETKDFVVVYGVVRGLREIRGRQLSPGSRDFIVDVTASKFAAGEMGVVGWGELGCCGNDIWRARQPSE